MGLAALYQQISTDASKLATDQGTVASLTSQLATAQAAVEADNQTVTADDTAFATALAAAPYGGLALFPDPNSAGNFLLTQVITAAPGFSVTPVLVAS